MKHEGKEPIMTGRRGGVLFTIGILVLTAALTLQVPWAQARTGSEKKSAWLGVSVEELSQMDRQRFHLESGQGVLVSDVAADSPADLVDLEGGDVILALDGTGIKSPRHFHRIMEKKEPGDTLWLQVIHDGKEKKMKVRLGSLEGEEEGLESLGQWPPFAWLTAYDRPHMGILPQDLNEDLARYFGVDPKGGILIAEVEKGGPAHKAGLKSGDILTRIEKEDVASSQEIREILLDYEPGHDIEVAVIRSGKTMKMRVTLKESPLQDKVEALKEFWRDLEKQSRSFQRELRGLGDWGAAEGWI
jgi:serine protease Do